jgi:ribonuclease HI
MNELVFYTDGSSKGNPGSGGFGIVGLNKYYSQTISDYIEKYTIFYNYAETYENVTNNQMELKAILHVLKLAAMHKKWDFTVYSDSAYAVNSINNWIYGWARNSWINSKKKPVENLDLMKEIYSYIEFSTENFKLKKIEGHSGHLGNELADALAKGDKIKYNNLCFKYNIRNLQNKYNDSMLTKEKIFNIINKDR